MAVKKSLENLRKNYQPQIPSILQNTSAVAFCNGKNGDPVPKEELRKLFPKTFDQPYCSLVKKSVPKKKMTLGVVFSGGQAAGGHNVLAGLWDTIQSWDAASKLIGFLGGCSGIIENKHKLLGKQEIDSVRNMGGFDLIGSGRTKIETPEQMEASFKTCMQHKLDTLIIIGGDDSNTNAAILAEYFLERNCPTKVLGVPKTIDGDLRSKELEISFGFDSACKVYAEMIGNIARDALSMKKYYHFIKLMGRSASHIALECALATHPNLTLISEEKKSLSTIVQELVELIVQRKKAGKEYGVILVPEGLIEFIPEMGTLIAELNTLLAREEQNPTERLTQANRTLFASLPEKIRTQLLLKRDPHGNVAVSQIETEQLLMELTRQELKKQSIEVVFQEHFFGYEGRACFPSNFDANYAYALGIVTAIAARDGLTGMVAAIQNLVGPVSNWVPKMVPTVRLMHMEMRKGKEKPVIAKTIVDLQGKLFLEFCVQQKRWKLDDDYQYPGPIQFFGEAELTNTTPKILERKE